MLSLLRQRNYGLLWFGQVVSIAGDWVLFASLAFYVYSLTGSALATGIMFMLETLPRVLLGSVAGVFVDRWDRRVTMIAADLLRALLILALLAVRSTGQMWIVYCVAVAEAGVSQFFGPAKNALVPRIIRPDELVKGNSLSSVGEQIARLSGPPLGGVMLAGLGLSSVVIFDTVSFVVSAAMLALMALPAGAARAERAPARAATAGEDDHGAAGPGTIATIMVEVWRQWLDGVRLMRRNRIVAGLLLAYTITMVGEGLIDVLFAPWVSRVMGGSSLTFGWLLSAQAVGGIAGGAIIAQAGKSASERWLFTLGAAGWGLIDLAIFNVRWLPLSLALFVMVGLPIAGLIVGTNTIMQNEVPDAYRGRVFGALGTTGSLTMLVGMALSSGLADGAGIVPMLNVACVTILVGAAVAWARLIAPPPAGEPAEG